jgi:hypothetical protein
MPVFLIVCIAVIAVVWLYILIIREFLVEMWPERFQRWHAIEDRLWARSRTILIARLYIVGSIAIAVHDAVAAQRPDWTPLIGQITAIVPESYRPIALSIWLAITGLALEWLRRQTTVPLSERKLEP